MTHGAVNRQRRVGQRPEPAPIGRRRGRFRAVGPEKQDHRRIRVAPGQRNPCADCRRQGLRHARDDFKRDTVHREPAHVLAPRPEDERIAALQPDHAPARLRPRDEQGLDLLPRPDSPFRALINANLLAVRPAPGKQLGMDGAVVDNNVRGSDQLLRATGDQTGITGSGTNKGNLAWSH